MSGRASLIAAVVGADGEILEHGTDIDVPWWSFSKTVIAAAALRLAEARRIDLDATLAGQAYTLRHLLQHRAGVADYGGSADYHAAVARADPPWTDAALIARFPPDRLQFVPGTGFAYSNVGYLLVRRAIERACDRPLPDALAHLVLAPLGLSASRLAQTQADMANTAFPASARYDPGWVFHGVVIGPAVEAALALHRLLTGALLDRASLAAMLDAHPACGALPERPWQRGAYGLGLMTGDMQGPGMAAPMPVVGHSAGGPGSVGAVYRSGTSTVAVFTEGADEGVPEFAAGKTAPHAARERRSAKGTQK